MEISELLNDYSILGVIGNYKSNLNLSGKVKDLKVKNINKALKIVGLDESYLDYDIKDLTNSELWKIELATKFDKDIIIVGNLSTNLIFRDIEYMKKLFLKLNKNYNKKVIIIDNNLNVFINLVKRIIVRENKEIIYQTSDFYDDELYKYVKMPKIVEFVKYANKKGAKLHNHLDIYELLKEIYRGVS